MYLLVTKYVTKMSRFKEEDVDGRLLENFRKMAVEKESEFHKSMEIYTKVPTQVFKFENALKDLLCT